MIKFVTLLKRRAGMSRAEFVEYYESRHAVLAAPYLQAERYERRFIKAVPHPIDGSLRDEFDCVTELWFEDEDAMNAAFERVGKPGVAEMIEEDERQIFDRERMLCFVVTQEIRS